MSAPGHRRAYSDDSPPPAVWTPFRIGWTTVLVVTVLARAYTLSSWSWLQDDLLLTSLVPGSGLGAYVVQDVAGHVFPGELLLAWVMTTVDPLDYTWAALSICVFAALVVIGWGLALRELFGERLHLVGALVLLTLSPGATLISHWWISALNILPMQASMGFSIYFLARYFRRGHRRSDLVWLNVSYALGLFMWGKSLLVTIPLFFLVLLLGADSVRKGVAVAVRVLWPTALLTAAYLVFYAWAALGAATGEPYVEHPRTLGGAASLLGRGTVNSLLPWLVGGPFEMPDTTTSPFGETSGALALLLCVAAVLLALVGAALRRRGVLMLVMGGFYALVSWGLVFFSDRFPAFGAAVIDVPRYSADVLGVVLLTCLLLATPLVGESDPLRRPVSAGTLRLVGRGLVAYAVVVSAVAAANSGRAWDSIQASSSKPYVDNMLTEARALGAATVHDSSPPTWLVNSVLLADAGRLSAILGPLDLPLRYDEPTETLLVLDDDGHFREAAIDGVTNARPGPDGDCGDLVETGDAVTIPLGSALFPSVWGVEISYFTGGEARVAVRTDDDEVELDLSVPPPGTIAHRQLVVEGAVGSVTIEGLAGDQGVCVTEVRAGTLVPTDAVPEQLRDSPAA